VELILNLMWVLVAAAALAGWLLTNSRAKNELGPQLIALAMLLVILFPAISITDDLWAAHNPAEADVLVRRFHVPAHHHGVANHAAPPFLVSRFQPPAMSAPGHAFLPRWECPLNLAPARFSLSIRPPPVLYLRACHFLTPSGLA
jgi:hypothetical protein